jgi:multicomponent Na+:H+ antiporter subunit A
MVAVSMFFARKVFLGKPKTFEKKPNEKGATFLIGPGILVLLSLVLGLFPGNLGTAVIKPALGVVSSEMIDVKLKIWHGFNQVFFLSLLTIVLGLALYWAMLKKKRLLETWHKVNSVIFSIELDEVFAWVMDKFVQVAQFKTKTVQHGYHRYYILTIIVFTSLLLWFQVFVIRSWEFGIPFSLKPFYISGLAVVILGAAVTSAVSMSRIVTIISMGVAGYGISLIFMYYSAIDLAITQIIVETLTVVMFMAILQRLPRFAVLSSRRTRLRDFVIALSFGAVMTILAIKAVNVNLNPTISRFFVENSYSKAFGENVVNVILVDFRALDTLGEVTVLTIAATGVFLLLKTKNKKL